MDRLFRAVLRHRKAVMALFIVVTIACALCVPFVRVNYDFSKYLPADSPSTVALDTMNEAFDAAVPNGRLYVEGISLVQAAELDEKLAALDRIDDVMWLGDTVDTKVPLQTYDAATIDAWYDGNGYLYQLTIDTSDAGGAVVAVSEVRDLCSQYTDGAVDLSGDAVNTATAQGSSSREIQLILLMAVVVIFGLLLLTSESWFEPVLFLVVIGMAIVMNLGTNIFRGEISFITQMCAAILQLAVSMDYGIVMLHAFRSFREEGLEPEEAMVQAMHKAFSVIASSAATTFFGFLSLMVMSFLIGADMGIVLAKGVALSFIAVMFFLPALILVAQKPLEKTKHRKLLPSFDRFARVCVRVAVPVSIIAVILAVPAFLGQQKVDYVYGAAGFVEPGTQLYEETQDTEDRFGRNENWVVLVPQGQWGDETALITDLEQNPLISGVTSYSTVASERIPTGMAPSGQIDQLLSGDYSRLILSTKVAGEGDLPFGLVQEVRDTCAKYYGDDYRLVGSAVSAYDMKTVTSSDSLKVTLASMIAIGIVLILMFKSISIPIFLLLSIEISIWINLAIPYFAGQSIQYIGYLIISAIQLGATVDYTIILARSYLDERVDKRPMDAVRAAISKSAITILTSATILTVAGALIGVISSNGVIATLGTLIGRGAFISALFTFLFLPMLFVVGDGLIRRTTLGLHFLKRDKKEVGHEAT